MLRTVVALARGRLFLRRQHGRVGRGEGRGRSLLAKDVQEAEHLQASRQRVQDGKADDAELVAELARPEHNVGYEVDARVEHDEKVGHAHVDGGEVLVLELAFGVDDVDDARHGSGQIANEEDGDHAKQGQGQCSARLAAVARRRGRDIGADGRGRVLGVSESERSSPQVA